MIDGYFSDPKRNLVFYDKHPTKIAVTKEDITALVFNINSNCDKILDVLGKLFKKETLLSDYSESFMATVKNIFESNKDVLNKITKIISNKQQLDNLNDFNKRLDKYRQTFSNEVENKKRNVELLEQNLKIFKDNIEILYFRGG